MRLLLAEDEHSLSRAIVAILIKNNYSVDAVYDGVEALDQIEKSALEQAFFCQYILGLKEYVYFFAKRLNL